MGTLYYGDNLEILKRYLKDESVDLVYLDPPFNSAQNYNAFFQEKDGSAAASQIHAFEDTWHWDIETKKAYDAVTEQPGKVSDVMQAFYTFLGGNDMMAYLTMMSSRLVELRRVLKSNGSLYLHCDPTASHYLKLLCDALMGKDNFRTEIIWKRASAHNDPRKCGDIHDTLLFYSKGNSYTWNPQYTAYTQDYLDAEWNELPSGRYWKAENMLDPRNSMELYDFMGTKAHWRTSYEKMKELWDAPQTEVPNSHGRIKLRRDGKPSKRCRIMFLDELPGVPLQSIWADIPSLRGGAAERLGYPTQKPVALLERIILASTNPGGLVLDPFCGCGTTIDAAEKNGRNWIGIDVTQLAISLIKNRLQDTYGSRMKFISGGAHAPRVSGSAPSPDPSSAHELSHASASATRASLTTPEAGALPGISLVRIIGEPTTPNEAATLAEDDKYQFQWWALGLVGARPVEQKKGADHGIDGKILFRDDPKAAKPEQIIIQVKGGKTGVKDVRDLRGVLDREKATIGILISLQPPTAPMETEAASAGFYEHKTNKQKYPRIQLRTVKELMEGKGIERPSTVAATDETFKKAPESKKKQHEQKALEL